jgi:hypothetical protein
MQPEPYTYERAYYRPDDLYVTDVIEGNAGVWVTHPLLGRVPVHKSDLELDLIVRAHELRPGDRIQGTREHVLTKPLPTRVGQRIAVLSRHPDYLPARRLIFKADTRVPIVRPL